MAWLLALLALWLCLLAWRARPAARALLSAPLAPAVEGTGHLRWRLQAGDELARAKVDLVEELEALRAALAQQSLADAEHRALLAENADLRAFARLTPRPGYRSLAAQVLTRDPASGGRRVRLNRGSLDGVAPGQPVLARGLLFGRISEVTPTNAVAITLADPQCKVSVWLPALGVHGILIGRGENDWLAEPVCELHYLPRDQTYEAGMTVESSIYGAQVPMGLPIGRLAATPGRPVVRAHHQLYQIASVRPEALLGEPPRFLAILIPWHSGVSLPLPVP